VVKGFDAEAIGLKRFVQAEVDHVPEIVE